MSQRVKTKVLRPQLFYATVMMFLTLTVGVFFREFTRFAFADLNLETQVSAGYYISQAHGHAFSIGFVIPVALAAMTYMLRKTLDQPATKRLRKLFRVYMAGGALTILLLFYKGIVFAAKLGQTPSLSWDVIDESLYWGSVMIRSLVYSVAHIAFGVTIGWYLVILIKKMRAAWKET
jgi:heme/copper-type cytochrome/quinol oxidase subunit 1